MQNQPDDDQPLVFQSKKLEAALRKRLAIGNRSIIRRDVRYMTELQLDFEAIDDISDIVNFENLEYLSIGKSYLKDVSPLRALTKLKYLSLHNGQPGDYSPIGDLASLRYLHLDFTRSTSTEFLTRLTNLRGLSWGDVAKSDRDMVIIGSLTNLRYLGLETNYVANVSPLSGLVNLQVLDLHQNKVTDISPLSRLTKLQHLILRLNDVSDVRPLSGLRNLRYLNLNQTKAVDFSPLQGIKGLQIDTLGGSPKLGIL